MVGGVVCDINFFLVERTEDQGGEREREEEISKNKRGREREEKAMSHIASSRILSFLFKKRLVVSCRKKSPVGGWNERTWVGGNERTKTERERGKLARKNKKSNFDFCMASVSFLYAKKEMTAQVYFRHPLCAVWLPLGYIPISHLKKKQVKLY